MSTCAQCECKAYREASPGFCKCGHEYRIHDETTKAVFDLELSEGRTVLDTPRDQEIEISGSEKTIAFAASLGSVGAGIYLMSFHSLLDSSALDIDAISYFEIIAKGMGAFFIAIGIWIGPAYRNRAKQLNLLKKIEDHLARRD